MSGIVGIFSSAPGDRERSALAVMLEQLRPRGSESSLITGEDGFALAVARHPWELDSDFSGPVFVGRDGDLAAAADASLYYVSDLKRALRQRGVHPLSDAATHLILAAYRAWGEECVDHLEGDFSFVLWDGANRTVFAARDFQGKRPLYFAQLGERLAVASSLSAVLAHPSCPDELNLTALAEDAALLSGSVSETCYRAISRLPAGSVLHWAPGGDLRVVNRWKPPVFRDRSTGDDFDSAAEELRELLVAAVAERMSSAADTSIWMSGGWDSPSLFAVGEEGLRRCGDRRRLWPVSISYPVGDPGREDDLIAAIVEFWNSTATWVDSSRVSAFDRFVQRTATREESYPHLFEAMTRELALGSRSLGARIALDGNGGDQLFAASTVYRLDLLRSGRWLELYSDWRGSGSGGLRAFSREVVEPSMPEPMLRGIRSMRGGRSSDVFGFERRIPPWIDSRFAAAHGLEERERSHLPVRRGSSMSAAESTWYLTSGIFPRAVSGLATTALENGIESRSPFMDRRVVEFAASRPRADRRSGRETKRLLRRSMGGLLPDSILSPRTSRTGLPIGYFLRSFVESFPELYEGYLRDPVLAELGIVDRDRLAQAWDEFQRRGSRRTAAALHVSLEVEAWLRHRLGGELIDPAPAEGTTTLVFGH